MTIVKNHISQGSLPATVSVLLFFCNIRIIHSHFPLFVSSDLFLSLYCIMYRKYMVAVSILAFLHNILIVSIQDIVFYFQFYLYIVFICKYILFYCSTIQTRCIFISQDTISYEKQKSPAVINCRTFLLSSSVVVKEYCKRLSYDLQHRSMCLSLSLLH